MTQTTIDVSVILCAYTEKRWDAMVAAIQSVQQQTFPAGEIILVIDHNPALLERARARIPGVLVIENSEAQGLSGARNSGIAAAQGAWLAFLDDDAVAEPDWLEKLFELCQEPRVLGAGGAAEPLWLSKQPRWFPEEFYWVIGCTYQGLPCTAEPVRNLYGCSMCIRKEVFDTVGGFRFGIGRVGTIPTGCEETELCIRAKQHWPEKAFFYEPASRIHHQVPANRATWRYFCSRCYGEGLSKKAISRLVGAKDSLSSERSYTLHTLPRGIWHGLRDAAVRHDPAGLARAGAIVIGLFITAAGYLVGNLQLQVKKWDPPRVEKHALVSASLKTES